MKSKKIFAPENFKRFYLRYIAPESADGEVHIGERAFPKIKDLTMRVLSKCGIGLFAFMLARAGVLYSAYPLGISLVCSANRNVLSLAAGAAIGAMTLEGVGLPYALAILLALALRIFAMKLTQLQDMGGVEIKSEGILASCRRAIEEKSTKPFAAWFSESARLRMSSACAAGFAVGTYRLAAGGFLPGDLAAVITLTVLCPALSFLYCGFFDARLRTSPAYDTGVCALLFSLVLSLSEIKLGMVSPAVILGGMITLVAAKRGGALRGGMVGMLCGLAAAPPLSPAFCVGGFFAGMFFDGAPYFSAAAYVLSASVWSYFSDGAQGVLLYAPQFLVSCAVVYPLCKGGFLSKLNFFAQSVTTKNAECETRIAKIREDEISKRLSELSGAMTTLSEVFYALSDKGKRAGMVDFGRMCDEVCDRYCRRCKAREFCWEREYNSTLDVISKLTNELYNFGRVSIEKVPEYMQQRCGSIDCIIEDLNFESARLVEETLRRDKNEIFAADFSGAAKIISDALLSAEEEYAEDREACDKILTELRDMDFCADCLYVYGKRRRTVICSGVSRTGERATGENLRLAAERACGMKMSEPMYDIKDGRANMVMKSVRKFSVSYGGAGGKMQGSEVSGDLISAFCSHEDYFYSMISDGMGSGKEAALTSRICGIFLQKMLSAGNGKNTSLDMLNSFVRARGVECSASIDLFELDLLCGRAAFVKSGAAPSYILRGKSLFKIQSKTVPIGIMRALDAEQTRFDVQSGDMIVMVSDGICQSFVECPWLCELVTNTEEREPEKLAAEIYAQAKTELSGADDMSVLVLRIDDAPDEE